MKDKSSTRALKILIVTQYFWPENMRINDLVIDFVKKGHDVTVLTGLPNYPEGKVFPSYKENPALFLNYHGAKIIRVPMTARGKRSVTLAFNYFSFFVSASIIGLYKLRKQKFDSIFVYAVSPIMAAIPAIIIGKAKNSPVFIWVLDLWPDTLEAVGITKNRKVLQLVGLMVSWIYNRADYLLLQSRSFVQDVRQYCTQYISPDRLIYFPSWAEDNFTVKPQESSDILNRDEKVFTILFAGNIGDSQDFPSICEAIKTVKTNIPIRWVIVGDGRASPWLHEYISSNNIKNVLLLGRHPLEKMPPLFSVADALLVSLKTNRVFEKTIPGKVQAYLASGKPIIAMIDGEAARVINESGAGLACRSGDVQALREAVSKMVSLTVSQKEAMGDAGRAYYLQNFSKDKLLAQLENYFNSASVRGDKS